MAEPKNKRTPLPVRRVRPVDLRMERPVERPDAVLETLRATPGWRPPEQVALQMQQQQQMLQQRLQQTHARATRIRLHRRALALADNNPLVIDPTLGMSDDEVVRQWEQEQAWRANQPQIGPANPVWNYSPEARRALGYYTNEERELAARMNDMRSASFFGGVMPNFGREAAWRNPGAEFDAFRGTATYLPDAMMAGMSFGLPSATTTFANGVRQGWQTAGNWATRAGNAVVQGSKAAAPVVTNPRWAATTTSIVAPAVAEAAGNSGNGDSHEWVLPTLVVGGFAAPYLWRGGKRLFGFAGKEADLVASAATRYTYQPDKRFWTWEKPLTWERTLMRTALEAQDAAIIGEWNSVAGNPQGLTQFINKYQIRMREGEPVWEPMTRRVPVTERVQRPVMEDVPSSVLGPDGNPVMTQRARLDANGRPVMEEVDQQVLDNLGSPVYRDEPILGPDGQPMLRYKVGANGETVMNYPMIDPKDVPDFLRYGNSDYTSTIPSVNNMIFIGPTRRQRNQAAWRNVGRGFTWTAGAGGIGYGLWNWLRPSTPQTEQPANGEQQNQDNPAPVDSLRATSIPGVYERKDSTGAWITVPAQLEKPDSVTNYLPDLPEE